MELMLQKPGYLFYSENFMFEGIHTVMQPLIKRINLSAAKVGEKMLLSNVFYEIDSWELKPESMEELNNLADLISYNKDIIVEIGGHTDSTGTDQHNLVLSEKRALSVVNYLINKGIASERLIYKGYGNTAPHDVIMLHMRGGSSTAEQKSKWSRGKNKNGRIGDGHFSLMLE